MKPVKLYEFAISHFCEKARWGLDYLNIAYQPIYLAPGLHLAKLRKMDLPKTSVPILEVPGQFIQGSKAILDWADQQQCTGERPEEKKSLLPEANELVEQCVNIEKRLDEVSGPHLRRYFYSEALVNYPKMVFPLLKKNVSLVEKTLFTLAQPLIRHVMIKSMELGPVKGRISKDKLAVELDWLDALLAKGQPFLCGDQLTRADITAASLYAPLVKPKEYSLSSELRFPPTIAELVQTWQNRPSFKWVSNLYRHYRMS